MAIKKLHGTFILFLILFSHSILIGQNLYEPQQRLWKPVQDDVYLQEVANKIKTDKPLQDIALYNNTCFALIDNKINKLQGDQFELVSNAPEGINRLTSIENTLWALGKSGIFQYKNKKRV